ncbi:hypothetical protein [Streptomyces avermitilis]|uniref:hypothetical protein n=1 Tax=Streptomyces avermitilis TaxID=33903 RepID=UPI003F4D4719
MPGEGEIGLDAALILDSSSCGSSASARWGGAHYSAGKPRYRLHALVRLVVRAGREQRTDRPFTRAS